MVIAYLSFLGLVALERTFELALSRRNAAWAFSQGGIEHGREHFFAMKLLHTAFSRPALSRSCSSAGRSSSGSALRC
jgi:isoprenylcysteine carboxyl methyltransferase (ICMT) family protein YpbQ